MRHKQGDDQRAAVAAGLFRWSERLVGIDGAAIHMRSGAELELTWAAESKRLPEDVLRLDETVAGPVTRALTSGSTQVATADEADTTPVMRAFGWKSAVCVPLIVDDGIIGVFSAGWRSRTPVSDDILLILEAAASMTAAALHRTALAHDLDRERRRLRDALEALPVAASIVDITGPRVRWRNKIARRYFGNVTDPDALEVMFQSRGTKLTREDPSTRYRSMLVDQNAPRHTIVEDSGGRQRILAPTIARLDDHSSVVIHVDVTRDVHIDEERSRFVRMVSHQLRTPLTPLLGFFQLMADDSLDPATRQEAVAVIETSVNEIIELVARLEHIATLQPVDIYAMSAVRPENLVREAWNLLETDAELRISDRSGDSRALCMQTYVVQALREMFANALTHGQAPVDVDLTADTAITVRISDHGEGIPVEWERAMFAPFMSAKDGYIAPAADHAGLGLTLARGLVLASHGELTYDNGAFSIRLKLATR